MLNGLYIIDLSPLNRCTPFFHTCCYSSEDRLMPKFCQILVEIFSTAQAKTVAAMERTSTFARPRDWQSVTRPRRLWKPYVRFRRFRYTTMVASLPFESRRHHYRNHLIDRLKTVMWRLHTTSSGETERGVARREQYIWIRTVRIMKPSFGSRNDHVAPVVCF